MGTLQVIASIPAGCRTKWAVLGFGLILVAVAGATPPLRLTGVQHA